MAETGFELLVRAPGRQPHRRLVVTVPHSSIPALSDRPELEGSAREHAASGAVEEGEARTDRSSPLRASAEGAPLAFSGFKPFAVGLPAVTARRRLRQHGLDVDDWRAVSLRDGPPARAVLRRRRPGHGAGRWGWDDEVSGAETPSRDARCRRADARLGRPAVPGRATSARSADLRDAGSQGPRVPLPRKPARRTARLHRPAWARVQRSERGFYAADRSQLESSHLHEKLTSSSRSRQEPVTSDTIDSSSSMMRIPTEDVTVTETDGRAVPFEQHRAIWRAAYRMLGSLSEAEDAVQEACSGSSARTPAWSRT